MATAPSVSTDACIRCGRPLLRGACPRGHPQRAVPRRRRRWAPLVLLVLLLIATGGAAYTGLVWYPVRAASDLMRPSSRNFTEGLAAYRAAVAAFPQNADSPPLADAAAVFDAADAARAQLEAALIELEGRDTVTVPIVSRRPALRIANDVHAQMSSFYVDALELVADLEAASRYLTQLPPLLDSLENLQAVLIESPIVRVDDAVAAARPIAQQLRADLRALTPPAELSPLHASLLAIAGGIRNSIDELEREGAADSPVVAALVEDVENALGSFRETAEAAPRDALKAGLRARIDDLGLRADRIVAGLEQLRAEGIDGLSIPGG